MAHCDEYLELISAAIDGALSPAEREKLDAHLADCPECRALYEELAAVHAALLDLPPVEVPADLTERIMAAVAAEQVLPFEKKKAPIRWQKWLASAAVLAVVLAGTWSWRSWEHNTAKDLKSGSPAPAAAMQESTTDVGVQPEASQVAPRNSLQTTLRDDADSLPVSESAPDPGTYTVNGGDAAAKVSADTQMDKILPAAGDAPAQTQEEAVEIPLRMSRMSPAPESDGGDGVDPAMPTEAPQEAMEASTTDPEESISVQPVIMTTRLLTGDANTGQILTPREALDRLLAEYPKPGCETWEYEEIEPGWRSPIWIADDCTCWLQYEGIPYGAEHYFCSYAEEGDELVPLGGFSVPLDGGEIIISGS